MDLIKNYVSQPSTFKGVFGLLATAGVMIPEAAAQPVSGIVLGALGLWEVIRNERRKDNR